MTLDKTQWRRLDMLWRIELNKVKISIETACCQSAHTVLCLYHKTFDWSDAKNAWLKQERGITFEAVVFHLAHGGLLDTIEHPNRRQYPGQRIFIVNVEGYVCLVPFVESDETFFLKTIIPSRKMTKRYLGGEAP